MHSEHNKKYRVYSYFQGVNALEVFIVELQEKQEFIQTIGYIYVRIFHIYHSICKLLHQMNEKTNEYREYFEQLLKKIRPTLSLFQRQACLNYFIHGNKLLYGSSSGLTLSFCIGCKNRLHQIRQTLRQNLEDNREAIDWIEFVLVDFGSTDGLQEWVVENFMDEIEEGYLRYYYTEELSFWHTSIAKNTSHVLAMNDIVVNLDCDNFTGKNGGLFVIENMIKYGWQKTLIHQFNNEYCEGSYGRIALSRSNFLWLGGYDESFEPAGYQDKDLLLRAQLLGIDYINLSDRRYNEALLNTKEETVMNTSSALSWYEMDRHNNQLSLKNITSGRLIANQDKDHIGIVENIFTFQDE
jgi:hypothetical protein